MSSFRRPPWVAVTIGALFLSAAAGLHDLVPREPVAIEPPGSPVLAAVSVGHATAAGSFAWALAVTHRANAPRPSADALLRTCQTAHAFAPDLRVPLAQGSVLVRRSGGDPVPLLEAGARSFPEDPWFPWARAMHAWLYEDDPDAARTWLGRAARRAPAGPYDAIAASLPEGR